MSTAAVRRRYTPEEYLTLERKAEFKSEYLNGEIYAMSGASREHNLVSTNLGGQLYLQLMERPCESYSSEMRVYVPSTGLYTYPDVVVVCDEPRFQDREFDNLLNPTVLFEVLSPSTEAYDRGKKFAHYRSIESLQEYVVVAQDRVSVEQYSRKDRQWMLTAWNSLDDVLRLDSIGCEIPLSEVYARVKFPPTVV